MDWSTRTLVPAALLFLLACTVQPSTGPTSTQVPRGGPRERRGDRACAIRLPLLEHCQYV